jgi:hypothetical protein
MEASFRTLQNVSSSSVVPFIVKCGIFLQDHIGKTSFICNNDFVEE